MWGTITEVIRNEKGIWKLEGVILPCSVEEKLRKSTDMQRIRLLLYSFSFGSWYYDWQEFKFPLHF